MRQYYAQRCCGGDNPLRTGIVALDNVYYIQDNYYFDNHYGGRAVFRTPWQVEAFVNGTCGAARRNRQTGLWEEAYRSGRSDFALVRSLRDRRQVRLVSVHLLIVHDDLGLCKGPTGYPTLPDVARFLPRRFVRTSSPTAVPTATARQPIAPPRSQRANTVIADTGALARIAAMHGNHGAGAGSAEDARR